MKIFISHATEDKEKIARPLAIALREKGYQIWFDEYSLKLGDSLTAEIDRGLVECDYGVVILSRAFFAKKWTHKELGGLIAKENSSTVNTVILPIWHEIDADEIRNYSPILADRVAVSTSGGLRKVVDEIIKVVEGYKTSPSIFSESNILPMPKIHFSELELKLHREFEITKKTFSSKSKPQKLVIQFTNYTDRVIHIKKISYSDTGLGLPKSVLSRSYRLDNNGLYVLIPIESSKSAVDLMASYTVELSFGSRWDADQINSWSGRWGYLHLELIYDDITVNLQYSI